MAESFSVFDQEKVALGELQLIKISLQSSFDQIMALPREVRDIGAGAVIAVAARLALTLEPLLIEKASPAAPPPSSTEAASSC